MISYTVLRELYSSSSRLYAERVKGNNNLAFLDNWEQGIKDYFNYYGPKTNIVFNIFARSISNIEHGKEIIIEDVFSQPRSPMDSNADNEMARYQEIAKAIIVQSRQFKKSVFGSSDIELKDMYDKIDLLQKRFISLLVIDSFSLDTAYQIYICFQEVKYYIYLELVHQNADLKKFYGNDIEDEEEEIIYSIYLDIQKLVADGAILAKNNDLKKLLDELQQKVRAYGADEPNVLCHTLYQIHELKEQPINYITTAVSGKDVRDCLNTSYINDSGKRVVISEYSLSKDGLPELLTDIAKDRKSNVEIGYYWVNDNWDALEIADYNIYFLIKVEEHYSNKAFDNHVHCLTNNVITTYRNENIDDSNIERIIDVQRGCNKIVTEEYGSKADYLEKKSFATYSLQRDGDDLVCDNCFISSDGQRVKIHTLITPIDFALFSWKKEISIDEQVYAAQGRSDSISDILFKDHGSFDTSLYLKSR